MQSQESTIGQTLKKTVVVVLVKSWQWLEQLSSSTNTFLLRRSVGRLIYAMLIYYIKSAYTSRNGSSEQGLKKKKKNLIQYNNNASVSDR